MKTLNSTDAIIMLALIQAITFLTEGKAIITKMTATEYNFSNFIGLRKTFNVFNVGYSAKSKNDALMMIKIQVESLEEEKSKLEKNYTEIKVKAKNKSEATPAELMALFKGA